MNNTSSELDPVTEFYLMFSEALRDARGSAVTPTIRRYARMPFAEVVRIIAPNGLRVTLQKQGDTPVLPMEVVP